MRNPDQRVSQRERDRSIADQREFYKDEKDNDAQTDEGKMHVD